MQLQNSAKIEEEETTLILGIIPARGGSVRVPLKNIKPLGCKPLIHWTIKEALKSGYIDMLFVSTDSPEIASISMQTYYRELMVDHHLFKFGIIDRPAELSEDVDTTLVLQHAITYVDEKITKWGIKNSNIDYVVTLQPTSPLRTAEDIDRCIEIALNSDADTVVSVSEVSQHPYWMFEEQEVSGGSFTFKHWKPFMGDEWLIGENLVSQNLPKLYYPNGAVYVNKRDLIMEETRMFGTNIEGYIMSPERSIDLETKLDFMICEAVMNYYGFK